MFDFSSQPRLLNSFKIVLQGSRNGSTLLYFFARVSSLGVQSLNLGFLTTMFSSEPDIRDFIIMICLLRLEPLDACETGELYRSIGLPCDALAVSNLSFDKWTIPP